MVDSHSEPSLYGFKAQAMLDGPQPMMKEFVLISFNPMGVRGVASAPQTE